MKLIDYVIGCCVGIVVIVCVLPNISRKITKRKYVQTKHLGLIDWVLHPITCWQLTKRKRQEIMGRRISIYACRERLEKE